MSAWTGERKLHSYMSWFSFFSPAPNPSITLSLFSFTSVRVTPNEDALFPSLGVALLGSEANHRRHWPEHCWAKRIRRHSVIIYRFSARKIWNDNVTFSVKIDRQSILRARMQHRHLIFMSLNRSALLTFWPAWRETRPPSRTERAAGMKSTKQGIVRGEGSLPGNAAVAQVRSPAFPQSSTHLHVSLDRNQAINHNWNLTRSTRV